MHVYEARECMFMRQTLVRDGDIMRQTLSKDGDRISIKVRVRVRIRDTWTGLCVM